MGVDEVIKRLHKTLPLTFDNDKQSVIAYYTGFNLLNEESGVLGKIFSFKGEFDRKEYLFFGIIMPLLIVIGGGVAASVIFESNQEMRNTILAVFMLFGVYIMMIAAVKRARETASNTFLVMVLWVAFMPVMMIYLLLAPSGETREAKSPAVRVAGTLIGTALLGAALIFFVQVRDKNKTNRKAEQAYSRHDYAEAAKLWKPLAQKGDIRALYNLGVLYLQGKGVKRDYAKAVSLFTKAAQKGDADAMYNLGVMYDQGMGVGKDIAKAVGFFRQAAQKGVANAKLNLGVAYYYGEGVEQNVRKAYQLWSEAAEKGVREAEANLKLLCSEHSEICKS